MPGTNKPDIKKALSCATALLLLCGALLSAIYITEEAGHDCECNDCPICVRIQRCGEALHKAYGREAAPAAAVIAALFFIASCLPSVHNPVQKTHVSAKVRLNSRKFRDAQCPFAYGRRIPFTAHKEGSTEVYL